MRVAIPTWNGRVSPVFDEARRVRVVDINISRGCMTADTTRTLKIGRSAVSLAELGVNLLVCSAISTPLETVLKSSGVDVVPNVCGSVDEILKAIISGDASLGDFRTPGKYWRHGVRSKSVADRRKKSGAARRARSG